MVDDYEPFCRLLHSLLEDANLSIVGEAGDGIEAVHKARLLQPDLILLDIGLPKLNGISAAEQMRKRAPQSKILFLAQDNSPDVTAAALNSGALGYLHKTRIYRDLLPAIESVLAAKQVVSSGHEIARRTTNSAGY